MTFLASTALAIHVLWIGWVIFGAFFTRGRVVLSALHILSLVWGIIVEVSPLPCPFTLTEQFLESQSGQSYRGGFLVHYLDRLVYPDLPVSLLVSLAVAVCVLNLGTYLWRFSRVRAYPADR